MVSVMDLNGNNIGVFDGNVIRDKAGKIIYWISGNEVYAPLEYIGEDLTGFNKGQFSLIGEYIEGKCIINNEVVFIVGRK
jgi:hypothetical protein